MNNLAIMELTDEEMEMIVGGSWLSSIWSSVKSAAKTVASAVSSAATYVAKNIDTITDYIPIVSSVKDLVESGWNLMTNQTSWKAAAQFLIDGVQLGLSCCYIGLDTLVEVATEAAEDSL